MPLVRPALAVLTSARPERTRTTAILDSDYEKQPGRAHAVRCALTLHEDGWHAEPAPHQASHILTSMLGADCLAIVPAAGRRAGRGRVIESSLFAPSMNRVNVHVRLFAILRERAGHDSIQIQLDEGATVADALVLLGREPSLENLLARLPVQMAVNRDYAGLQTLLHAEDELALIPPISGGAGEVHARITAEPLSLEVLSRGVSSPRAGAIVSFQGVTREVARLDYEAYREMAERQLAGRTPAHR
jgi:molybdopterin converting factor small subunit